jgi:hypothetical protein
VDMDERKVDKAVLGLLYLGLHDDYRAWKCFDWDAMGRGPLVFAAKSDGRICLLS